MRHIASRDNPHFKATKKLCLSGRERRKSGRILLNGMHLVESYIQHFGKPEEIPISERGLQQREIADFIESVRVICSITVLADSFFDEMAVVETPSGIMAVIIQPQCAHGLNQEIDTIVLDGIQDPGNLGSILQSAAAAGFRQEILSSDCAQAWSRKVLRSAMGGSFSTGYTRKLRFVRFSWGVSGAGHSDDA